MKKETLSLLYIKQDLERYLRFKVSNKAEWRQTYYVPITAIALIVGIYLKNVWIGLLIFSFAAYHIVRYVLESREYRALKKEILDALSRGDVSVSVEKLDHIAVDRIYEPHFGKTNSKLVSFFYFESGRSWRLPTIVKHYKWSREYCVSNDGLSNISIHGDDFYFISLQGYDDIAYIYPCKFFTLDERIGKAT